MMEDGIGQTDDPGCQPLPERAAKRTHLRMLPGSCAVFTPLTPGPGMMHMGISLRLAFSLPDPARARL